MRFKFASLVMVGATVTLSVTPTKADDINSGQKTFHQCAVCHSLAEGQTKIGPSLFHVIGRKSGSLAEYPYSDAMKKIGLTWDEPTLLKYLNSPRSIVPGTKMTFPGIKDGQKIKDLIAYLKSVSG
jgi:cytochrome c